MNNTAMEVVYLQRCICCHSRGPCSHTDLRGAAVCTWHARLRPSPVYSYPGSPMQKSWVSRRSLPLRSASSQAPLQTTVHCRHSNHARHDSPAVSQAQSAALPLQQTMCALYCIDTNRRVPLDAEAGTTVGRSPQTGITCPHVSRNHLTVNLNTAGGGLAGSAHVLAHRPAIRLGRDGERTVLKAGDACEVRAACNCTARSPCVVLNWCLASCAP